MNENLITFFFQFQCKFVIVPTVYTDIYKIQSHVLLPHLFYHIGIFTSSLIALIIENINYRYFLLFQCFNLFFISLFSWIDEEQKDWNIFLLVFWCGVITGIIYILVLRHIRRFLIGRILRGYTVAANALL